MKKFLESATNNSRIISYLKGPDYLNQLWIKSFLYKMLDIGFNAPISGLKKLHQRWSNIHSNSLIFKLVGILSEKFHILIGLFLILTMIIPDNRWYNIYGVILTLVLFMMFLIKTVIIPKDRIDFSSLDPVLIIFFISIFMAGMASLFPMDSLNNLIYYLITFMTIIIITSSIDSYDDLYSVIKLILIGTLLTALYGVYQWKIVGIQVNPSLTDLTINQGMGGRVYSTMGNPNVYGELLVLTLPFFGTVIINEKTFLKKLIWAVILMPVVVILLKTGSRSAWVAFAVSVFIFVFFWKRKLVPFLILLGILALPFLPSSIYQRILTIFNPNDTSLKYRKQILGPAYAMLRDYWITGVGLGNRVFSIIYQRYKSFGLTTVAHTHNLYVQIWLEAGIVTVSSLVLLVLRLVKRTFIVVKEKKNLKLNNILIASLSSILGLCVMGLADHIWFYNRILFMFWVNIAVILTSLKLIKKEN